MGEMTHLLSPGPPPVWFEQATRSPARGTSQPSQDDSRPLARPHLPPMELQSRPSVGTLSEQWDRLVDHQPHPSPFLKSWWIDNTASGELVVLCCFSGNLLVGGAAFEVDTHGKGLLRVPRVRFAGQGVLAPDHMDLIADPDFRPAVTKAVARWLWACRAMVDLDGLTPTCALPALLGLNIIERTPCPFMELEPGTDPIAGVPGRLRSTIKRSGKRLAKSGFTTRRVTSDVDGALMRLLELHEQRWEDETAFASGWTRFHDAVAAGHAVGDVVIHELANEEGFVIASELELNAGNTTAFYQAGRLTDRDYRGSGSVLKAEVIRWAQNTGITEFDLLRGDERYKDDWSTGERDIIRARGAATATKSWIASVAADVLKDRIEGIVSLLNKSLGEERTTKLVRGVKQSLR